MYVILQKNGVVLASDGPEYVVLFDGQEHYRGLHKGAAEEQARRLAYPTNTWDRFTYHR